VIYPGSTPVGNATLVVANMLTCNKYSPYVFTESSGVLLCCLRCAVQVPGSRLASMFELSHLKQHPHDAEGRVFL
jgi:hypothetical protein